MFCDFNVSYSPNVLPFASYPKRLKIGFHLLMQIPERIVLTIICLAKAIFGLILLCFSLGFISSIKYECITNWLRFTNNASSAILDFFAILAPIHSLEWQNKIDTWVQKALENKLDEPVSRSLILNGMVR